MRRDAPGHDVIVVGAGPAGSTTAGLLARAGWRVSLLDRARFPRAKPCGECLNPGAVAALERLGLLSRIRELEPATLAGWRIRTPESDTAVGTFAPEARDGLALPRTELDRALVTASRERGAELEEGVRVEEVRPTGSGPPSVRLRTGRGRLETRTASVVVGADGLRSITARSLDIHRRRPRLRKVSLSARIRGRGPPRKRGRLVLSGRGVVGLAPVHARRPLWNVTVVTAAESADERIAGRPGEFVLEALADTRPGWKEEPVLEAGPWASGPFDWPVRRAWAPGVVLVGDAAGYYDPLTGQGIHRALRSAELAADAVDRALRGRRSSWEALRAYDRSVKREFAAGRLLQKGIETVVSRDRPREWVVGALARAPRSLSALIRVTGDASSPASLLRPGSWLPLAGAADDEEAGPTIADEHSSGGTTCER